MPHRQAVNQICRQLMKQGVVIRQPDPVTGKIVNRLVEHVADRQDALPPPERTSPTAALTGPARYVRLNGEEAVRQFAYVGEVGLTEDQVKRTVAEILRADAWAVDMRWGRAHGIDIEARRGPERLVLEAKGEGSRPAMRVNFFLGELLQRMDGPNARYGLALPAHRQFVSLALRLPSWARAHLNIWFFLARPAPDGGFEVGVFPPVGHRP
jgi:hypothetical protein